MSQLTRIFIVAFAFFMLPGPLCGQSGVLLGLFERLPNQSTGKTVLPRLRSLWIAPRATGLSPIELPALAVPRSDGWWLLGITRKCSDYCDSGWSEAEELWAKKGMQKAALTQAERHCQALFRKGPRKEEWRLSGETTQDITFVSPDWISLTTREDEHEPCELRGGRSSTFKKVYPFDQRDQQVDFESLLGPSSEQNYSAALEAVRSDPKLVEQQCAILPQEDVPAEGDWSIARGHGSWIALAYEDVNYDCSFEAEIKQPVPQKITGPDKLLLPWPVLVQNIPKIVDAISSPSADLVVAVLPTELQVYSVSGAHLDKKLGTVEIGKNENIVMIQWATGRNVARWTADLTTVRAALAK